MTIQALDENLLLGLNSLLGQSSALDTIVEPIAVYAIYAVPVILFLLWFRGVREVGIRAALAGLFYFVIATPLIAELWFRPRPDLAEIGGQELFFHRPTYSFPSDHAGFLAAIALTFYLSGYRKLAQALFVITILVSLGRIIIGFHWPTDIVGGWVFGMGVAWLIHRYRDSIDRCVGKPVIRLAQRLKLA